MNLKRSKTDITQDELKKILYYNHETGIFIRRVNRSANARAGAVAGCLSFGYLVTNIDGKQYKNHRLAWLYMEGYFPGKGVLIDHIDRVKDNNRWSNLRMVSHSCNIRNSRISRANKTGITGVKLTKANKHWVVTVSVGGQSIYIGDYKTKIDAAKARWDAEVKYGYPNCNTTSSALKFINDFYGEEMNVKII